MNKLSYLCQVLVEIPEEVYKDFSEQADLLFHSAVGGLHNDKDQWLLSVIRVENDVVPKYSIFTEGGGV